ncbi:MAG: adenylosuccinate lyase, partial [Elusimicrobia bacterium]|nr:adenylosuccinate lyase [Elusimicrobiota bacterium]
LLAAEAQARRGGADPKAVRILRQKAHVDVDRILEIEKTTKHDVIAFLTQVEEAVGPAAKALHVGLTSSDVLDTALAVQMKNAADLLIPALKELMDVVKRLALRHKNTLTMGRSHGIHAEPVTFGFKVANWYSELKRGLSRLQAAREEISFGKLSGAVGTFAHNDPAIEADVCRKLGLKPEPVSTQVIPRDRHAQYLQAIALVGAGLERIATEIRHLQRTEVLEAEEPFSKGQKGSSAMPHKRNPIASENICGLARLLRGYALSALEDVALWHERDISHSSVERVVLPDATLALDFMIHRMAQVLSGLQVYPERMKANMEKTSEIVCSQRLVIALAKTGLPKQEAYELVQKHALAAWTQGVPFRQAVSSDPRILSRLRGPEINACFDLKPFVKNIGKILKRSLT